MDPTYSDWEVNAPDAKTMLAAAVAMGLPYTVNSKTRTPAGLVADATLADGTLVSVNFYGKKYLPTGATQDDGQGNQIPVTAAQPGVYAILRWLGQSPFPTDKVPSSVTVVPLPTNSPVVFA